ncbi:hypothetical protein ACJBU6_05571 [Exserohilum turcicum]
MAEQQQQQQQQKEGKQGQGKRKITFYFDIVSPFAYIAYYIFKTSPVFNQVEITHVPVFLGGLMHATGNVAPMNVKNKGKWIERERKRFTTAFQIPFSATPIPNFPIFTLPMQRALTALSLSHPHKLDAAMDLIWQNFWATYNEPEKPENLRALLTTVLGSEVEAQDVMERAKSEQVKKLLTERTMRAFDEGAFGLPWFVATNAKGESEGFWGVDYIGRLCDHLEIERPVGKQWRAVL